MDAIYISGNSFKVIEDKTAEFSSGRRVKLSCGLDGIKYASVITSSYSSPYTTVTIDESDLTASLTDALYGVTQAGAIGSLPNHNHDGLEGSGGTVSGVGDTVSGTDDHEHAAYVPWNFGAATISGTGDIYAGYYYGDGSTLSGIATSGTDDHPHSAYVPWDFGTGTISGTGDIYSGSLNIDDSAVISMNFLDLEITNDILSGDVVLVGTSNPINLPTFISDTTTIDIVGGSTLICNKPVDTQSDDYMIACITIEGSTPGVSLSGWQLITSNSQSNVYTFILYKVATGAEPSNYIFNISGTNTDALIVISTFRYVADVGNYAIQANGFTTNGTSPAIDITDDNELVVHIVGAGSGVTFTGPATWDTQSFIRTGTTSTAIAQHVATKYFSIGSTGTTTSVGSATTEMVSGKVALKPLIGYQQIPIIKGTPGGSVRLYYGTGVALETTASGIRVFDDIYCNDIYTASGTVYIGDLKLSTDGQNLLVNEQPIEATGGGGSTTFSGLSDTPDTYDNGKYLKSTAVGTEWAAIDIPTFSGTWVETDYEARELVAEYILSSETLDATLSGVQGNTNSRWIIEVNVVDTSGSVNEVRIQFNSDTAANYGYTAFGEDRGAVGGSNNLTMTSAYIGYLLAAAEYAGTNELFLASGKARHIIGADVRRPTRSNSVNGEWRNTADEITTMRLFSTGSLTGSIKVYKRTNISLPIIEGIPGADTTISGSYIKGVQSMKVEYATASGIYINPGVIDVNNVLYENETRTTLSGSFVADTWYYVYASGDGTNLSFTTSSGIPTIDYNKMGYYSGDDRCIGFVLTDSSGDIRKYHTAHGRYDYHNDVLTTMNWQLLSTDVDYDFDVHVPFGNMTVFMNLYGRSDTSNNTAVVIGTPGDTLKLWAQNNGAISGAIYTNNFPALICNDSKQLRTRAQYDFLASYWTTGFQIPDYIYNPGNFSQLAGAGGGTSDVQSFTDLDDTPTTYSGTDGQYLMSTGSGIDFTQLSPAPAEGNWVLVATIEADNETFSESIPWDGDTWPRARIESSWQGSPTNLDDLTLRFNNDSGSNYGVAYVIQNGTATQSAYASTTHARFALGSVSAARQCFSTTDMYLKSGGSRHFISADSIYDTADIDRVNGTYAGHWTNTSSVITSLDIASTSNCTGEIKVYRWRDITEEDLRSNSFIGLDDTPATYSGTDGQVLVSTASGIDFKNNGWTYSTEHATTSGTIVTFDDIPAGVTSIEVMLAGVKTSTNTKPAIIQLGDAGGIETSGYDISNELGSSTFHTTDGWRTVIDSIHLSAMTHYGCLKLRKFIPSQNLWLGDYLFMTSTGNNVRYGSGFKTLTGELTSVALTTSDGIATFTGGSAVIRYK